MTSALITYIHGDAQPHVITLLVVHTRENDNVGRANLIF